jgi:hypothetical protein
MHIFGSFRHFSEKDHNRRGVSIELMPEKPYKLLCICIRGYIIYVYTYMKMSFSCSCLLLLFAINTQTSGLSYERQSIMSLSTLFIEL